MKKYPKIGIRPTIDGRQGGVRESLEDKTMNLAKAVAELISSNLKNGDGSPVECVIADSTIGRVAESAACAEKFEREGVGATITVTSCWCYGSETMDMHPHWPKAVWGFNGTERPGAVYLAAVLAGKLRSCAVWKKESMTMKNMPRQWPGLKNIASPTKGKTLRTVPKSAKPVKRRMPTGNLL